MGSPGRLCAWRSRGTDAPFAGEVTRGGLDQGRGYGLERSMTDRHRLPPEIRVRKSRKVAPIVRDRLPLRYTFDPTLTRDVADSGVGDPVPEGGRCARDAIIAPSRIPVRCAQDEFDDLRSARRRSPRPSVPTLSPRSGGHPPARTGEWPQWLLDRPFRITGTTASSSSRRSSQPGSDRSIRRLRVRRHPSESTWSLRFRIC